MHTSVLKTLKIMSLGTICNRENLIKIVQVISGRIHLTRRPTLHRQTYTWRPSPSERRMDWTCASPCRQRGGKLVHHCWKCTFHMAAFGEMQLVHAHHGLMSPEERRQKRTVLTTKCIMYFISHNSMIRVIWWFIWCHDLCRSYKLFWCKYCDQFCNLTAYHLLKFV